MHKIVLFFLLLTTSITTQAYEHCLKIVGNWSGEIFNEKENYFYIYEIHYKKTGKFILTADIQSTDGDNEGNFYMIGETVESGTWECKDNTLFTNTNIINGEEVIDDPKSYEILEITDTYSRIKTSSGFFPGVIYERYKK